MLTSGARKLYDCLFCYGEEPKGSTDITWFASINGVRANTVRRWMKELTATSTATIWEPEPEHMSGLRPIPLPSPTLTRLSRRVRT